MYASLRMAGLIGQIIAWSGRQIVLWNQVQLRGQPTWAVHSTLVVSAQIRSLDYKKSRFLRVTAAHEKLTAGNLIAATSGGIESWRTDPTADIVVWDRLWDRPYGDAHSIVLAPSLQHIAWFSAVSDSVT